MGSDHPTPGREQVPDLLSRPPSGTRAFVTSWDRLLLDPVGQLETLAGLFAIGLISDAEYERHKGQVRGL